MKNERDRLRFMSGVVSVSEILAYWDQDSYLNLAEAANERGPCVPGVQSSPV